jgi:hypothetical protein
MQVSVFQVLEARRAELGAELGAVDTLAEHRRARLAYDEVMAGGLPELPTLRAAGGDVLP